MRYSTVLTIGGVSGYLLLLYSYIATITASPILNLGGDIDVTGRIIVGSFLFCSSTGCLIVSRLLK